MNDELDIHLLKLGVLLRVERILYETIQIFGEAFLLANYETEQDTLNYYQYLKDNHIWGSRNAMETINELLNDQLQKVQTKIKNPEQFKKAQVHLSRSNEALNPLYVKSEENYYPQQVPSRVYRAQSPRRNVRKNKPRSPTKIQEILQIKAKNRQERLLQQEQLLLQQQEDSLQKEQQQKEQELAKLFAQEEKIRNQSCQLYKELLEEGVKIRRKQAILMRSFVMDKNIEKKKEAGKLEPLIREIAKEMAKLNIPCDPTVNNKDLPTWFDEQIVIENEFQIRIAKESNKQPYFPFAPLVPYETLRKKSPERKYPTPF